MTYAHSLLAIISFALASITSPLLAQQIGDPDLYIPPTIEVAATTNTDAFRGAMLGMSAGEMGLKRTIRFRQDRSVETRDLLPMVFFDPASSTIPDRYATFFRTSEADDYSERDEADAAASRFDETTKYHEVVNIIGYRMRQFPSTTITLQGSYSTEPGESAQIAAERAVVVKEYLERIWRIDPRRIAIRAPQRGCDSTDHLFRQEEARHVVIESDDWMIHRPVRYYHTTSSTETIMLHLAVDPRVAPEEVAELTIVMTAGDDLLSTTRFNGSADSSRYRLLCFWVLPRKPDALANGVTFQAVLTLYDGSRRLSAPLTLPVTFSTEEDNESFDINRFEERERAYETAREEREKKERKEEDYYEERDEAYAPDTAESDQEYPSDAEETGEEHPSDAEESEEQWDDGDDSVIDDTTGTVMEGSDTSASMPDSTDAGGVDSADDAESEWEDGVEEENHEEYDENEFDDQAYDGEGADSTVFVEERELTLEERLTREMEDEKTSITSIPFYGSGDTTLRAFQRMMIDRCVTTLEAERRSYYGYDAERNVYISVVGYGEEGENPEVDAVRMATGAAASTSYSSGLDRFYDDPSFQTSLVTIPTLEEIEADPLGWSQRFLATVFGDRADEIMGRQGAAEWNDDELPRVYDDETSARIDSLLTARARGAAAAFKETCLPRLCDSISVIGHFSRFGMPMHYLPEQRFYARSVDFSLNYRHEEYEEIEEEEAESSEEPDDETGEREEGMNEADAEEGPDE